MRALPPILGVVALVAAACGTPTESTAVPANRAPEPAPVEAPVRTPEVPESPASADALARIPDVAERVVQSVVSVTTTRARMVPRGVHPLMPYGGQMPPQQGLGSGVIVDASGVIVTNHHVVDGAETVEVTLPDGTALEAEVVGSDPKSDVAVLQLSDPPDDLVALSWGDSGDLRLGEVVLAVGNPFGVGQTVTMGIVSATGRARMGIVDYEDFIQTDAAINPGNSGGALVDLDGHLVGINTAIYSRSGGSQGIGFAIPAVMAEPLVANLLEDGVVQRGWLGVAIQDIDTALRDAMDLPTTDGVLIGDVTEDSPAAEAGLQRGDVVTSINGEPTPTSAKLRNLVAAAGPNAAFEAVVLRNGKEKVLKGTLGLLGGEASLAAAGTDLGGLKLSTLDGAVRERLGLPDRVKGVVVSGVEPGSLSDGAGLQPGDVLLEVNRQPVTEPADVASAWREPALLLVLRDGATRYVVLR